jgi:hypothetical protein
LHSTQQQQSLASAAAPVAVAALSVNNSGLVQRWQVGLLATCHKLVQSSHALVEELPPYM